MYKYVYALIVSVAHRKLRARRESELESKRESPMSATPTKKPIQGCALLYDNTPELNTARLISILQRSGSHRCQAHMAGHDATGKVVVYGEVQLDAHTIDLISVAAPADDQASRLTILEALLSEEERQTLLRHHAYIHCLYTGGSPEPLEQLRALYRVVQALTEVCAPARALGLLDIPALQAFSLPHLLDLLRWLDADPPPLSLWVRTVGLSGEQGGSSGVGAIWLVTRGMAHFFQPEVAVSGQYVPDAESAESLLMSIASWLIQGTTRLHLGDTLEMMAEEAVESRVSRWRCASPAPEQRWLSSPYGTVVLEPAQ
jgi:hypothetical protein